MIDEAVGAAADEGSARFDDDPGCPSFAERADYPYPPRLKKREGDEEGNADRLAGRPPPERSEPGRVKRDDESIMVAPMAATKASCSLPC